LRIDAIISDQLGRLMIQIFHMLKKIAAGAATKAAEAARDASKLAQNVLNSNPALKLVGNVITVGKHTLLIESLIAEGGFASVYLAVPPVYPHGPHGPPASPPQSTERVVLKKMFASGGEVVSQLTNEVKLMERLQNPGIVKVLGSEARRVGDGIEIYVILEYCPGGHLLSRLNAIMDSGKILPPAKIYDLFLMILQPVEYMHSQSPPIAHRDLKFENVLICSDGTLRLCDFGSASTHRGVVTDKRDRLEQEDAITRFTTPHFRAPEQVDLYDGSPLDERVDVWALGCMLYGLAYFKHPFLETGPLAILSARYKIPQTPVFPAPINTMIRACLQLHPDNRPSARQLIEYIKVIQTSPPDGPWPDLKLSGGGLFPTSIEEPHQISGKSSGTESTPNTTLTATSTGFLKKPDIHRATAVEIAAKIAADTATSGGSGAASKALAARMARKSAPNSSSAPVIASSDSSTFAPTLQPQVARAPSISTAVTQDSFSESFSQLSFSPAPSQAPTQARVQASPPSDAFDMFNAPTQTSSSSATTSLDDFFSSSQSNDLVSSKVTIDPFDFFK
jgi:serine/threonine protein kinase